MHEGSIKSVVLARGFGFISEPNQPDVFFHCKDLANDLAFDEMLIERRVRFEIIGTDKGLQAKNVRAAD